MLSAALCFFGTANAHGRLTVPETRFCPGGPPCAEYQDDPVSGGATSENFVCREDGPKTPTDTLTAGGSLTLQWDFGAAHVGDCAVYISYDINESRANQQYFKIANLFDCKSQNRQDIPITLPDWLPAGQAVLRWDWTALHVYPNVEFYSQCSDVTIVNNGSPININQLVTYSIIAPAIYPANGNDGVGYRNPFSNSEQYMTGPNCANGYAGNSCSLTAPGTTGYVNVGDLTPVTAPTPQPTVVGASPTPPPTLTPECVTYVVQSGDTLTSIAAYFTSQGKTVSATEICDFNNIEDCDVIEVGGDDLMIPCETCGCTTVIGGGLTGTTPCDPNAATTESSGNGGLIVTIVFLVLTIIVLLITLIGSPGTASEKFGGFKAMTWDKIKKDPSEKAADEPKAERRATVTKIEVDQEGNKKEVAWAI